MPSNTVPLMSVLARADNSIEVIYQQHHARIFGLLYRLLGNEADAEDVSQQLFLKLCQTQPDQLPVDETRLVGWLYRVTLNEGYNALRSQKRRTAWHETFDRLWPFSRSAPDPAYLVEQQDTQARVQRLLTELKPPEAKLLLLRHAGLSYKELASVLDVPLSSVGSLLTEARRKFAKKYQSAFAQEMYDEATLTTYLDGELSPTEREWVEAQLTASAELQGKLAQLLRESELVNQALDLMAPLSLSPAVSLPGLKQQPLYQPSRNGSKPHHGPDLLVWESQPLLSQLKTSVRQLNFGRLLLQTAGVTLSLILLLILGVSLVGWWTRESTQPGEQLTQPEMVIPHQAEPMQSESILFTTLANESKGSLYTLNPDGTELKLVGELDSENGPPRLSPNGQQIVFPGAAGNDIYVMNSDGTNLINLTNMPDQVESFPAWSPDGEQIAYTDAESLNLIQSDGANLVRLTDKPANYGQHVWSPDGQRLAFISDQAGSWDLYVINAECASLPEGCGTHLLNLTQDGMMERYPTWSPDGQQIAFADEAGIAIINVDGTQRLDLPYDNPDYLSLRQLIWSPDGQRIAFVASRASPNLSEQVQTLFTIQPDGSNLTALTDKETWAGAWFAWSPSGQQIAYSVGILDDSVLYRMNADGSQPIRLTDNNLKGINYIEWGIPPRQIAEEAPPQQVIREEEEQGNLSLILGNSYCLVGLLMLILIIVGVIFIRRK